MNLVGVGICRTDMALLPTSNGKMVAEEQQMDSDSETVKQRWTNDK